MATRTKMSQRILPPAVSFEEMMGMTPLDMAQRSYLVMSNFQELLNQANSLRNTTYRDMMLECLLEPKMTFMEKYRTQRQQEEAKAKLVEAGYAEASTPIENLFPPDPDRPQPYLTTPSSHMDFYNAHPGGLCVTVALNCRISEYYTHMYQDHFGVPVDRELSVACLCIHEYPKAWLYYWRPDFSWPDDPILIGAATWDAHDVYVTAELMHRNFDPFMVMAVAAAHDMGQLSAWMEGPQAVVQWTGYDEVVKFVHAAALLADKDPRDYGLERKNGKYRLPPQPVEIWISHLADMNWPYTMGAAHLWTHELLREVARNAYNLTDKDLAGLPFNKFKAFVWSQVGQIPLYETLVREGKDASTSLVHAVVRR